MAMYSWAQIVTKVFDMFPESTDVDLAERLGVTRQTIASWRKDLEKGASALKVPEWSSIESVAKGLLKAVTKADIKPTTIEEMALVGWADQVVAKRAFFSMSNSQTMANFLKSENQKNSFWKNAGLGSGVGAGVGASAFLLGSALGPLGVAVGAAVGAATGIFFSKETTRQNNKLKQELERQMEEIGRSYGDSLLELTESIISAERRFSENKRMWSKAVEKVFADNKEAASRLDQKIVGTVIKSIEDMPSPIKMFDLDSELTNEILKDLKKNHGRG